MINRALKTSAGAAALAFSIWLTPAIAQPMYDRLHVDLPYKVTLGDKVLPPGDYTIQQLPSQSDSRVLLFYTDNGMKFQTSALTIPALDPNTPSDTKVILNHVGDDYYIKRIWVQGKDYGYELPIPNSLKNRQKEAATETTVAGRYEPTPSTTPTTTAQTTTATSPAPGTATDTSNATARTTSPSYSSSAASTAPTTSTVNPNTSPAAPTDRNATANNANSYNRNLSAQAAPAPTPAPAPAEQTPAPTRMPNTSANWLMMLLSGGMLSGAGVMLGRKR